MSNSKENIPTNYKEPKKAMIVQDISAIGRVSTMVALPILSSMGVHVSALPTALLSTHSGEFKNFSFLDLTDEMEKIITHWKSLDLKFDAVQTGYLGSPKQVHEVTKAIELAKENSLIVVDPVMADNGKLYSGISDEMVKSMRKLCEKANILIPNLTEACLLIEREYENRHNEPEYIKTILNELHEKLGTKQIVLTGVSSKEGKYGAVCFDATTNKTEYFEQDRIDDHFFGTGDIFASVLTGALLNGKSIQESTSIATEFTQRTIKMSKEQNLERRFGVCFEQSIPFLLKRMELV